MIVAYKQCNKIYYKQFWRSPSRFANRRPSPTINQRLNHDGFTIIEVALVLAIAGLIFLVVFIAWPALQNSQQDTARRQDVGRVVSALEQYNVDNQGSLQQNWVLYARASNNIGGLAYTVSADGLSQGNNGDFGGYLSGLSSNVSGVFISDYNNMPETLNMVNNYENVQLRLGRGKNWILVQKHSHCHGDVMLNWDINSVAVAIQLSNGSVYYVRAQS